MLARDRNRKIRGSSGIQPFDYNHLINRSINILIAQELQLEVKRSTHKHERKRLIVEQLVDEDVLPDSCLEVYKPLPMEPSGQYEIRRLEIERELKLRESEARERELEAQQRKE